MIEELKAIGFISDFPKHECTIQDEREPEVFLGTEDYWIILKSTEFSDEYRILKCKPYTAEDDSTVYFGWTDQWGNPFSNEVNPIYAYDTNTPIETIWKEIENKP